MIFAIKHRFVGLACILLIASCTKAKTGTTVRTLPAAFQAFPSDTRVMVGINGDKLRQSKEFGPGSHLYQTVVDEIRSAELAKLKQCGINLWEGVRSVVVGAAQARDKGYAVMSGITRVALQQCIRAKVAGLPIHEDGAFTVIGGRPLLWLDGDTALFGDDWNKETLEERRASKRGAATNSALMSLVAKVDTKKFMWGAVVEHLDVPSVGEFEGFIGSIGLSEVLTVEIGAQSKDETSATTYAKRLKSLLPLVRSQAGPFKDLLKKAEISARGVFVQIRFRFSEDDVKHLVEMAWVVGAAIAHSDDRSQKLQRPVTEPDVDAGTQEIDTASQRELAQAIDAGVYKISDTAYRVDRALVDRLTADPLAIKGARIVPAIKNGKAVGFRLYAIRPSSVFSRLGFRNGDTVHTVNGFEFNSMSASLEMYNNLQGATKLTVTLTRRGKPVTLHYSIR